MKPEKGLRIRAEPEQMNHISSCKNFFLHQKLQRAPKSVAKGATWLHLVLVHVKHQLLEIYNNKFIQNFNKVIWIKFCLY